jgi:acetyltransferase-like isoleucine patch superfamily enzyme
MTIRGVHTKVAEDVEVGENISIGDYTVIEDKVRLGNNVIIGHNCVILKGTIIGDNIKIGHCTVLGQQPFRSPISTRKADKQPPLVIHDNCVIGSLVCISAGVELKKEVLIGDHASIREGNVIGERTIIGKAVNIEYDSKIGTHCKIMNSCHLTGKMTIGDHVFFGPMVTTTNDLYMDTRSVELKGPIVHNYALIGSNSTLLPGVDIGEYAIIGAGAVVLDDIPPHSLAVGVPARVVRRVLSGYPMKI